MSGYAPGTFQFAERIMDSKVKQAHHDASLRRWQHQATAGQKGSLPFYCVALARLGRHLTSWGERLQARYSTESPASRPQSANSLAGG